MPRSYKEIVNKEIKSYKNYSVIDGKAIYVNPDYNLLIGTNIDSDKILFCPQLFDEKCFQYYANMHRQKKVRATYRKTLNFIIGFSFLSMLAYSLSCINEHKKKICLGNWIPKTIITNERNENASHQITVNENNEKFYWNSYSTIQYVKDSFGKDRKTNWISRKMLNDYISVNEMRRTKLIGLPVAYDDEIMFSILKYVPQLSIYELSDELYDIVDKVRAGKYKFITLDRSKIADLFFNKVVPSTKKSKNNINDIVKVSDIDPELYKKYSGYRKIGSSELYCSTNKASKKPELIKKEHLVFIDIIEIYIRSLFDDENEMTFDKISMSIDKFFEMKHPRCTFKQDESEITTYFEFDPELLINLMKDETILNTYEDYVLYQIYEILTKCEECDGKYYFKMNYSRKENGRYYGYGNIVQNIPRELRNIVMSKYKSVDMNCGVYSLMLNIGRKYKYKGNVSEIEKMVMNRKAYREHLVDKNLEISYNDVKEKLTMISFGCKMNPQKMLDSIEYEIMNGDENSTYYRFYNSSLYDKSETMDEKYKVALWCNKPEVVELHNEISELGKYLIRKYIVNNKDGTRSLVNAINNEIVLSRHNRHSFGEKLAFIYQSEESVVLKSIYDNFSIDGTYLKDINGAVGLLLHDAVYIHKDIIENNKNITQMVSDYVMDTFGYDIKYQMD